MCKHIKIYTYIQMHATCIVYFVKHGYEIQKILPHRIRQISVVVRLKNAGPTL